MHRLKASIVIPARNEEQNLAQTVEALEVAFDTERIPYEIILVDDNSTDGTQAVARELQRQNASIKVAVRNPPGGFGRAIRSGLELVEGDLVIIYMADRSDDPVDALRYYRKIEEGYDCVFGTRFRPAAKVEGYPLTKLLVNRIANRLIQAMFMCRYNDLTNAFKAYRTSVIRECGPYRASHFNITIEMSLGALTHRYNIAEIPVSWHGRTWGSSHLHISEMGRRYLAVLLKCFSERLLVADDIYAERLAFQARRDEDYAELRERVAGLEKDMRKLNQQRQLSGKDS